MDTALRAKLLSVSTATLTTVMLKNGVRTTWMANTRPFASADRRVVGPAFTLRFIPAREDLATPDAWKGPMSTRAAIEDMPSGCVCVCDAMGVMDAGVFGDILIARMKKRGVAGVVTDGVMRDGAGVKAADLPVWCAGVAAPPGIASMVLAGYQEPVGCGGVAVFPNDVIVADADGAVVVPAAMAGMVADAAVEQERFEAWVVSEVEAGVPLPGLYPPDEETRARYEREDKGEKI